MKKVFFVFVYLVFAANTSRSDVVLGRGGPGPGEFINMGSIFSITFTPTEISRLDGFSLSMNVSHLIGSSDYVMRFSFYSDLSNHFVDVSKHLYNGGGPYLQSFNFGQSGPIVGLEQKTMYFGIVSATNGANSSDFDMLGQTSSEGLDGNWNVGASTSPNYYFNLEATAVPEPSTLTTMFAVFFLLFAIYQIKNFI